VKGLLIWQSLECHQLNTDTENAWQQCVLSQCCGLVMHHRA